jgi:formyl-CoA transferase
MLADFGADVIKIESPEGDTFRDSPMWPLVARGKRSVALDLRENEGCELLRRLVERSDILIENVPARVMERRDLTYEVLSKRNPGLIMVSISCFGAGGPYAGLPGSGTLAEAFGGLTHLTGEPDGAPILPSVALGDAVVAMSAVIGVLMACRARDVVTGEGQHIDVAMYEPILQIIGPALSGWTPGTPPPARSGSRLANPVSVRNVFRSADGRHLAISCSTPRHEAELLSAAGALDGKSLTADEMDRLVAEWIRSCPAAEVARVLRARRIPGVLVNDLGSLVEDVQVTDRGSVTMLPDGRMGVAPTPRLSATPGVIRSAGPALGEHSAEVLGDLLGLSAVDLADLSKRRVALMEPPARPVPANSSVGIS